MGQASPSTRPFTYTRHKPEETVLYRIVQSHWLSFQEQVQHDTGCSLPNFVIKEFDEYLRCGILAHGFLRVQCECCRFEHLVAFSCKRRGFCPSCGARRMSETTAHLGDNVLPMQPIRQWVISFPFQIRLLLAVKPKIMARALDISHSVIAAYYRKKRGLTKTKAKTGAVTLIQRFGGSLNLNVHFHMLFVDGSYELGSGEEPTYFLASKAPTLAELGQVLDKILTRLSKYLERQGIIVKDGSEEYAQEFQFSLDEGDIYPDIGGL